ncbi:MAG: cell division protein FtsA [Syntrophobacterales bacterium]|nr:cell division protein FtsA [Syntrophobacterales bacterium]
MTQELIVGLDIGTTKVCAVVGEVRDQQLDIVGIGTAPTAGGLRKGVVVNIDTTVRAIRKAVEEAETMAGCEIRSVYTGVAGAHIQGHNSHGVIVIKDREVTPLEVERVVESAKLMVSVPSDRAVIHTLVQEFLIDGQDGIKDPVGIHGVRLECRVHIVTAALNALNNIVKCTNKAGLEVSGIALQGLVCGEAVLTEEEKALGVALLDFGGGTTDLAIFAGNSLRYSAVIPVAGNNITNDIAVGLQTSLNHAEALKREYGCCLNALGAQEETIEIPGLGGRRPRSIARRELAEIIHLRLSELLGLIAKEIHRAGPAHPVLAGAVICGGSSLIPGLEQLVEDTLNLPARVGYPLVTGGLTDVMRDPAYATGVGLVLYGHRLQQGSAASSRLRGRRAGSRGNLWGRVKKWFQEVV